MYRFNSQSLQNIFLFNCNILQTCSVQPIQTAYMKLNLVRALTFAFLITTSVVILAWGAGNKCCNNAVLNDACVSTTPTQEISNTEFIFFRLVARFLATAVTI